MTSYRYYTILAALLCIIFSCTGTVLATEILVGEHLGNSTITAALANATNGDIIIVSDGTYNENIDVNKEVTIRSQNGSANTTIHAASTSNHVFHITADNVTISGLNVTGATTNSAGIFLDSSSNSTLTNNNVSANFYGIYLDSSSNNTLTSNNASDNAYGIYLASSSSNNTLASNNANDNSESGIYLYSSSNNTLTSNNASNNDDYGIYLYSSSNNLTSNNASDNAYGIYLASSSSNNTLTSNNVSNNDDYGIYLTSSSSNNLTSNNASDNAYGIYLTSSSNYNTLTSNNANDNSESGIYLYSSSNYNTLTSNNANDNDCGIYLYSSSSNNLTSNTMSSNTYNFEVGSSSIDNYLNDIDESNEVEGKPVYYWTNRADDVIPSTAGVVYVINSTNVTVKDIEITHESRGVMFYSTTNSTIENVTTSEGMFGIVLRNSSNNTLTSNNASENIGGIVLWESSNNTLTSNNASDNSYGIHFEESSNNNVTENAAIGNGISNLYALSSSNCIVDKLVLTDISTQISTVTDSSDTAISGTETNANNLSGKTNVNGYVNITRSGNLNVTFFYDDSGMSSSEESSIDLYRLNGSSWVEVAGNSLNTAGNNISANLSEFGMFGLFYDEDPSSSSSSSSNGGSSGSSGSYVATRVLSQGTTTTLSTNSDGELIGDAVAKSSDTKTTLILYKGTVGTDVSGNPVSRVIITTPASLPSDTPREVIESGLYYDFGPSGTTFSKEVLITIEFDPAEFKDRNPVIYTYTSEEGWIALETTVDWENGRATAYISHFSMYALFGTDVEEVVEETPQVSVESSATTVMEKEDIPVDEEGGSSLVYWILGIGIILSLGIVVLKKQKGEGGL
jgi:parallel beta-helix repeat protein